MTNTLMAVGLAVYALATFFIGNAMVNGLVLPNQLGWFYNAVTSPFLRMLCLMFPIWGLGNFFISYAFKLHATATGLTMVIMGSLCPLILAMFMENVKPTLEIYIAIAVLVCVCIWLHTALGRVI